MITTYKLVRQAYLAALGRKPTDAELGKMRAALNMAYVASDLLAEAETWFTSLLTGAEYVARSRTNTQFIQDAFLALYDRQAEAADVTFWLSELAIPHTRAVVIADLITFHEFSDHIDVTVPVDAYPTPDLGGPWPNKRIESVPDYDEITDTHEYEDKGISTNTVTTVAPITIDLDYDFATPERADPLVDHYNAAMGQNWEFDYTARDGTVYTARYQKDGFKRTHDKLQRIKQIKVRLIVRPN